MAKYRRGRINDAVAEELAIALGEVREPKVINNFVSITRAEVAPDLKYAKVFYSFLDDVEGEEAEIKRKEIKKGLESAKGFIRRELAMTLNLRITPELTFVPDTSVEYGAKISKILKTINEEEK